MSTTLPLAAVTSTIPLIFKRHLSPFVTNFRRARRTLCKLKTSKRRTPDFITVRFSSRRVIESRLKWNCKCEGPRSFRTIPLGRLSCPRVKVKELSQLGQFKNDLFGAAVQMECYAGGYPPPRISWRRENNAILPTGGSIYRGNILKIKQIKKEDRGTYYCVAENGVGRGTKSKLFFDEDSSTKMSGLLYENLVFTGNIAVEVEFAPVVSVPRPRLGQALQYDMDLECHVEAYPPPALTWVKDEVALSNNQHYSISHFATADEFTDTTLRVITIEKRQYGQYVCKAANKLGTAEGRVELFGKNFDD
jgi:hypothetical protein